MSSAEERALHAARETIAEVGWHEATLERIARRAGMSRMTLHRHGVTREVIRDRLVEALVADHQAALWPSLTAAGSGRARLRMALCAQCEVTERNLELLDALEAGPRDAMFHEPGAGALTREVFTAPLQRLLRDGMADGSLGACEPEEEATLLFNLIGWTYGHLRTGHGWTPSRAADAVVRVALDGVSA